MNENIREHFSNVMDKYDYVADNVVFKDEELHDFLVNSIPFDSNKEIKVLDLGCGTGHGMSLILNKFPNARVTGIDFSDKMVLRSEEKLKEFEGRFKLKGENFVEINFDEKYDAIVSAIAIHNITHEQKADLFAKISSSLKDGGVFINGDFIAGETFEIDRQYREMYRKYLEEKIQGEELQIWLKHALEEDKPMKLSQQFELLKENQFKETRLVWQYNNEAVYVARK